MRNIGVILVSRKESRRSSCTLHKILYYRQEKRQVVFSDVLIVGRLDVVGQSFAPIGLHKSFPASDWLLMKRHCIGTKGLPGVQLQN
jgi:hypothetical protein